MKRIVSFVLALMLCISLMPVACAAESTFSASGSHSMEKLTKREIQALLKDTTFSSDSGVWSVAPTLDPYTPGSLSLYVQRNMTARLNAWRQIAGVPSVIVDTDLSELCQYGAVISAAHDTLNHQPSAPRGMTKEFYQKAYQATKNSNLLAGVTPTYAVDALMTDSAARNVATVGHRRWQLNPEMGVVGFGYATRTSSKYRHFVCEYVVDYSGECSDFDFIAWPSSGNFPSDTRAFQRDTPWSISLNPKVFADPDVTKLVVAVSDVEGNTHWVFRGTDEYTVSDSGAYFGVAANNCGVGKTIIFRPAGSKRYDGVYHVSVSGLQTKDGKSATIDYLVDFFSTTETIQGEDDLPPKLQVSVTPAFTDVTGLHWAYSYIGAAAADGVVNGVGNNHFEPDRTVTGYEFATILLRGFFTGVAGVNTSTTPWYRNVDILAGQCNLWHGLEEMDKNAPLTRYEMAVMICNALRTKGYAVLSARAHSEIYTYISDWDIVPRKYEDAVVTCNYYGVLQGVGDGRFDGASNMTRAQAATVYCRLKDFLQNH